MYSGGVNIVNNMNQTVYYTSVANQPNNSMIELLAGSSIYESWCLPPVGGVSVKLSTTPDLDNILQFEYTLNEPTIYWDLSCINMDIPSLFTEAGFSVTSDNSDCQSAICTPGENYCTDAYMFPSDNQVVRGCEAATKLTLSLGGNPR